jgi:glucosamine-phosphate N-acetyltransferase
MNYTIRRIIKDDLNNNFLETLLNLYSDELTDHEKALALFGDLKDRFEKDYFIRVAMTDDGQVIGTATLIMDYKFIHNCQPSGRIEHVSTRQGYEGNGISKDLISTLTGIAIKNGCYKVILNCSDELIPFYQRCGFEKSGNELRLDINNS